MLRTIPTPVSRTDIIDFSVDDLSLDISEDGDIAVVYV